MDITNDPEINCVFCGLGFTSVENIEFHIQKSHQPNHIDICESRKLLSLDERKLNLSNKENDEVPSLNKDLRIVNINQTKIAIIKCPNLSKQMNDTASNMLNMSDHKIMSNFVKKETMKTEHLKSVYKHRCCKCFKHFLYQSTLVIHSQKHLHEEKPKHKCKKCGSRYSTKQILRKHSSQNCVLSFLPDIKSLDYQNSEFKSYFCKGCQTSFKSQVYLEMHQRRICKSSIKDKCVESSRSTLLSDASNNIRSQSARKRQHKTVSRRNKSRNALKVKETHSHLQISAQKNLNRKYHSISSEVLLKDSSLLLPLKSNDPDKLIIADQNLVSKDNNFTWHDPECNGLQKPFQCEICMKHFSNRSSLTNHIKSHYSSRGQPFICRECNQRFVNLITLQDHCRQTCSQKTLHFKSTLQKDVKYIPNTIYSLSNFNGVSQVQLWPPIKNNNSASQPVACVHCNGVFYDRLELEEHALSNHSDEHGNILCLLCQRTFTTNMALRVHLTKSHGFANGGCPGVSQTLPPMPRLDTSYNITNDIPHKKRRRRLFEYEKEFPCEFCNRNFSTCQALGNHRRACINIPNNLITVENSASNLNSNSKLHSIESLIFDNKTSRSTSFKDDKNVFLAFN